MPISLGGMPVIRGITTGGSTNVYTATAYEPPFEILEKYGIDIKQELADLRAELPIAPIADHLMNPASELFMQSAREIGYDCHKLDKFIYQDKCLQNCDACMMGCPNDAKWNSRYLVDEAVELGAEIVNDALVKQVMSEGDTAVGVEYKHNGKTVKAYADKIILSAGGIGSPLILRDSGFEQVGHDFCTDPVVVVCGQIEGLKGTGKAVPMMTGFHLEEEGVMISDLHMPQVLKTLFDVHAFNFGQARDYSDVIPIMVKVRDDLSGKIVNNGFIDKKISEEDQKKIDLGISIAEKILIQAGAKKTYHSRVFGAHPSSSVKVGEHVNADLKTKLDNLYVCDCSVYPEALGFPPALMILGLGARLAKHLAG
jgi:choline dehydrogenase-like flavoprotein